MQLACHSIIAYPRINTTTCSSANCPLKCKHSTRHSTSRKAAPMGFLARLRSRWLRSRTPNEASAPSVAPPVTPPTSPLGLLPSTSTPPAGQSSSGNILPIVLRNDTGASQLYAHITGSDEKGLVIISSDGKTTYRPMSPAAPLKPLAAASCAIALGSSGSSRTIYIPRMSGARIWFCKDQPLHFFVNPGPALVEPSATNTSDKNYGLDWGFCEFTWNKEQIYVNVSFVDFVSLPVSLRLDTADGVVKTVPGMPSGGLTRVCAKLEDQARREGKPWNRLVIRKLVDGKPLRALSPNTGGALLPGLFDGYYKSYVDTVWEKYKSEDLTVQTQFKWGHVKGRVDVKSGRLVFDSRQVGAFEKPSAQDIFTCSTGPFAAGHGVSDERLNVGARLAAALNRSTLHINSQQPEGEDVETYFDNTITNHYARICHETSLEGRGYAFPYDDVGASDSTDQSGFVNAPNPKMLTVVVGKPL